MTLWPRAVLHVDMDAFFASVEQLDRPELRGQPVIVGGSPESRGVVCAASYEARKFGVRSAMPTATARRLCPRGVFLPVRMDRYLELSERIFEILGRFTPDLEPVSCDEAFLEVTGCQRLIGEPPAIARQIKDAIRADTGLTASVGVAPSRFVAKIASDLGKPDGLTVIPAAEVRDRLAPLPVERLWGVGKATGEILRRLGISTVGQLRGWPRDVLIGRIGATGAALQELAEGRDDSQVVPEEKEKSISRENTFAQDVLNPAELERELLVLADDVAIRARRRGLRGRTVQIRVRYDDFSSITRRVTLPAPTCTARDLFDAGRRLLRERTDAGVRPVRLVGIGLSGFADDGGQAVLFGATGADRPERAEKLERAADRIREKLGKDAIGRGSQIE